MKMLIIAGMLLALAGCNNSSAIIQNSATELANKCAVPLSVEFTYAPTLFSSGSITFKCAEMKEKL